MTNEILDKIKGRGYWHLVARPTRFVKERIPSLRDCQTIVEKQQIKLQGWYFPHIDGNELKRGEDYIETSFSFSGMNEAWRFYQSGQFAFFRGLYEDWLNDNIIVPDSIKSTIKASTGLDVLATLYELSQIYEFVARLAQLGIFDDSLYVMIKLVNNAERRLFFWPGTGRHLSLRYMFQAPELARESTFNVTSFVAQSHELAYQHFAWIMERFGFYASEGVFRRDQERFFEGRG